MKKKSILIIEDEKGIADIITYPLSSEGLNPIWVTTGEKGLDELEKESVDLIILDVGLPDINGFELLKKVRKKYNIPVIFLTARAEEIDKVLGLELGGDDYVTKPFSPRELVARVKAVLRRQPAEKKVRKATAKNSFKIDKNKRIIFYFKQKLNLSRYEFDILNLLLKRPGWVYTRDMIMDLIWSEPEESFDRTVDAHIKNIRSKLKAVNPDVDPIITNRGVGYSIKEDI